MAIQDADPERRNLVVTSVAFIAYYLGEGTVNQEILKLPLLNVHFQNIQALVVMVWIGLLWFLFRYWLTHKSKFKTGINQDLNHVRSHPILRRYVESKTKIKLAPIALKEHITKEVGFAIAGVHVDESNNTFILTCQYYNIKRKNGLGNVEWSGSSPNIFENPETGERVDRLTLDFKGVRGKLTLAVLLLKCSITQPAVSSYVVPYLLCGAAITLGVHDLVSSPLAVLTKSLLVELIRCFT